MIRRLKQVIPEINQMVPKINQTSIHSIRNCGLFALITFVILILFSYESCAWAQTAEATQTATMAVKQTAVQSPVAKAIDQPLKDTKILGVPLWDDDLYKMIVRFLFDLFFLSLVVGIAYSARNQKSQRYIFNFVIMNIVVFFICFTLKKLELELGMALGLFAIFGILRYRTEQIDVKAMTYLFVVIGLAVINSLSNRKTSYVELVVTNSVVFGACLAMEYLLGPEAEKVKLTRSQIVYDKLDLLRPENITELYEDIYQRTGIRTDRVEVKQIDFPNSTSLIVVRQSREQAVGYQEEVASGKAS